MGPAEGRAGWSRQRARKRALEESSSRSGATLPQEKEVQVEDPRRDRISKALQQVLGQQEVSFRSVEQEQAMHAVLDGQNPLVVVLPTRGSKSLLFTVPAVVERSGVTVVVVPYRALMDNLVARIQKSRVKCIEWKHSKVNPASVVVVSADVAGDITSNSNFVAYTGLLLQRGLLQRVVVDKCHLVFMSDDWQPKLALLKNLQLLGCPIMLMTATLPLV
jgi:superfamily II DNA helicase RecQ